MPISEDRKASPAMPATRWPRILGWSLVLLLFGASVVVFRLTARGEWASARRDFEDDASDRVEKVAEGEQALDAILRSIGAFFDSSDSVEADEFHVFVSRAVRDTPEVIETVWAQRSAGAFHVGYRESTTPSLWPQGHDLATEPGFLNALQRAVSTRAPALSPPVRSGERGGEVVLTLLLPIFRKNDSAGDDDVQGVVAMSIQADALVGRAAARLAPVGIQIQVDDAESPTERRLVALHHVRIGEETSLPEEFQTSRTLSGRRWSFCCRANAAYADAHAGRMSWVFLGVGLLLTGLLATHLVGNGLRAAAVDRLVEQRTAELKRLTAILEATPDFVGIVDHTGRPVYLNEAGRRMIGVAEGDPKPEDPFKEAHPAWAHELIVRQAIPIATRDGTWRGETALLHRDGREIPVSQVFVAHRDGNGEVCYISTIARDISEMKRAEAALRESERLLQDIIDKTPSLIFVKDLEGRFTLINRAYQRLHGCAPAEVLGKTVFDLYPQQVARALADEDRRVRDGGLPIETEHSLPTPGGARTFLSTKFSLVRADGTVYGVCGVATDFTDRKRIEDETVAEYNRRLEAAVQDLRRAQDLVSTQEKLRALGQMASGIAHDFNNALSPVLGFAELLLNDPRLLDDRERALKYLGSIRTSARDAASVVRRLKEFYRPRGEGEPLVPIDLVRIAEETIDLTQPRWKDQARAASVPIEMCRELTAVPPVAGAEAELREALTNLIFNAVDAMPLGGTLTISTSTRANRAVLAVKDTGTGMTEEVRRKCLEPFFTTKGKAGTGMGLAMVYGIVQRHEGTLDIDSEPGKGTTVRLAFPACRPASETGRREVLPVGRRALRVLVVDDEPMVREVVKSFLELDGHASEMASNGREGLEAFQRGEYDLVVTDAAMPEMNGPALAAEVKRARPQTPVFLLTGFGDMMIARDERPEHVDLVLPKPITLDGLRQAIASIAQAQENARG